MSIVFIDIEVNSEDKVVDYGAYVNRNVFFHGNQKKFVRFIKGYEYVCGHNALAHDLIYLQEEITRAGIRKYIDTLPLSALLFAKRTYHYLVKDYKLDRDINNNPMVDASLTNRLFMDEVERFNSLPSRMKTIYHLLLHDRPDFQAFFEYIGYQSQHVAVEELIKEEYHARICASVDLSMLIREHPEELAYCLAIIREESMNSIAPKWVIHKYKDYYKVMDLLRGTPCGSCPYCDEHLDIHLALKKYFGYDSYRSFHGVALQEQVVQAQMNGNSIIAVFPTAGGKSLTFQIPALLMGEAAKGLTLVISPLQSLMNDQIENLQSKNINNVATINGSQNLFERNSARKRVYDGDINLLYLSPESLRMPSIFRLLAGRNIVRVVIDEAHCFSTWGHDFRVDYQYIGEFIREIAEVSPKEDMIPVSCFTATAKQEVIEDIKAYFDNTLGLKMDVYKTKTIRKNLHFYVHRCMDHKEKMIRIREILTEAEDKPVIIYTSRRRASEVVATELTQAGFPANVYHGGMEIGVKNSSQLEFTRGEKTVIVATSAFGMGIDKGDVGYVIHYQVSSTIEDYLQEAGRGGRDKDVEAQCHILYNDKDVEKHFNLLTQTKLTHTDINALWRTIKRETRRRKTITISIKELALRTGWDKDDYGIPTKVQNSILALEKVNYIKRLQNAPRLYASSIIPKTMEQASKQIRAIPGISDEQRQQLSRIVTTLFTDKTTSPSRGTKPISMIDDLSETLSIEKRDLIDMVNMLKQHKILDLDSDLFAHMPSDFSRKKSFLRLNATYAILRRLVELMTDREATYNLKELNTSFEEDIKDTSIKLIRTLINYLDVLKIIKQSKHGYNKNLHQLQLLVDRDKALDRVEGIRDVAQFILEYTYNIWEKDPDNKTASYSIVELKNQFDRSNSLFRSATSLQETEQALLLIHRIGALVIDGGFLVLYNPMRIEKIETNPQKQYTKQDYKEFEAYYNQKIKKIHILIHFVESLSENTEKGLSLVEDYFSMDYKEFERTYITKEYRKYYDKAMTRQQYDNLFTRLSIKQREIIEDKSTNNIVVLAGPGSGKTTLLVHKLAALIELEDVKFEELLMLTFSRSATVVFKEKLRELIGARANHVSIKTFHSYCFDVIGQVGTLDKTEHLFETAIEKIRNDEVEESLLNVTTLVVDEAQDMSAQEYRLIEAILEHNDGQTRLIAVGDDDQNIYEFRGSDSSNLYRFTEQNCNKYELLTNYRSKHNLVEFSQHFVESVRQRYKEGILESYTEENGHIILVKHISENLYEPVCKQLRTMNSKDSTAVLTYSNEDAEILSGLLLENGIRARLIQSNNGFRLHMLYEFDWLLKQLDSTMKYITSQQWTTLMEQFQSEFHTISLYPSLKEVLSGFETLYPDNKYRIDLEEYIRECKLDDMYRQSSGSVTVSTIHKSKGRQFSNVFIMLNHGVYTEQDKRALYVAMTRAQNNLVINTNQDVFRGISAQDLVVRTDTTEYDKPERLVFQMEHSHINLSGCKYTEHAMHQVHTDDELTVTDKGFEKAGRPVAYFSRLMTNEIEQRRAIGYQPVAATVTFKVKWYNKDEDRYYWIVLPKVMFEKQREIEQ